MLLSFWAFLAHKKYTLILLLGENLFSLIRSSGVSKNPFFYTDFKNVRMTLVKSAPKKSFAPKTDVFRTLNFSKFSIAKIVSWLKLFLGALFAKVICTFLKSVRKDGFFDAPFDLFKEKSFHLLEGTMNFFES